MAPQSGHRCQECRAGNDQDWLVRPKDSSCAKQIRDKRISRSNSTDFERNSTGFAVRNCSLNVRRHYTMIASAVAPATTARSSARRLIRSKDSSSPLLGRLATVRRGRALSENGARSPLKTMASEARANAPES